jgi:hypothetical protein
VSWGGDEQAHHLSRASALVIALGFGKEAEQRVQEEGSKHAVRHIEASEKVEWDAHGHGEHALCKRWRRLSAVLVVGGQARVARLRFATQLGAFERADEDRDEDLGEDEEDNCIRQRPQGGASTTHDERLWLVQA